MVPVDEEKTMKDIWASTESSLESPNFPGIYEAHTFKTVTYIMIKTWVSQKRHQSF